MRVTAPQVTIRRSEMKTFFSVMLAGAMLVSVSWSADSDPSREERFKTKTGRYTPAEEARRQAVTKCSDRECCRHKHVAVPQATAESNWKSMWFQSKWGRSTRIDELRQLKAQAGSTTSLPQTRASEAQTFFDLWSRAKWGRNLRRVNEQSQIQIAQATPAQSAPSPCATCDHPKCC
jgi:hypothetical protein